MATKPISTTTQSPTPFVLKTAESPSKSKKEHVHADEGSWAKYEKLQKKANDARAKAIVLKGSLSKEEDPQARQKIEKQLKTAESRAASLESELDKTALAIQNTDYLLEANLVVTTSNQDQTLPPESPEKNTDIELDKHSEQEPAEGTISKAAAITMSITAAICGALIGAIVIGTLALSGNPMVGGLIGAGVVGTLATSRMHLAPPATSQPKVVAACPRMQQVAKPQLLLSDGQLNLAAAFHWGMQAGDTIPRCNDYEQTRIAILNSSRVAWEKLSKSNPAYPRKEWDDLQQKLEFADIQHYELKNIPQSAWDLHAAAEQLNWLVIKVDRLEGKVPAQQP